MDTFDIIDGICNIPEGTQTIGAFAFYGCTRLQEIFLPKSVTFIGMNSFNGCIYNHRTTKTNQKYPSVNL